MNYFLEGLKVWVYIIGAWNTLLYGGDICVMLYIDSDYNLANCIEIAKLTYGIIDPSANLKSCQ